jgi:acetyl esterase
MIIRNSAYGDAWGILDPQVLARTKKKAIFTDEEAHRPINLAEIDFAEVRGGMGSPNKDLTSEPIDIRSILIKCKNRFIPARLFCLGDIKIASDACLFLHGGGFIGGTSIDMLNQCKLIAEKSRCSVISLDYRLAPETVFPGALDDVLESIEWIIDNQKDLRFSNSQIFVVGDSAGGNLAVAAGLLDSNHLIKEIISIYGAIDLQETSKTIYPWDYSLYQMEHDQEEFIHTRLNKIMFINNLMRPLYVGEEDVINPLISPTYADNFSNMPPITLIEAEFDYFLQSNKYFAEKLYQNNVEVQEVLYKGLDHGFFDRLGYLDQVEEACSDIAAIIQARLL